MSLLPASDSSPPLQDVRTTIYIGTPDTIKPVCYRDLVSVTSSMSYNELYELLVASNPAAPRLEELEPCCLVSCQEGKQFNIPRTQRIFGFIRTCDPGEFNGALTVWFQPTSDPDLEYVGYGVQQQLAMTPTMRIKQHRSSANHLERQQRNIQKKQRLSSPATSTPSPGSGMLFSPPATSSSGSSGMLFSSPSFLSESSVSTQSTQLVASPDPDIVQPLSPPFASWSPDIQFWLRASEELSDKKMPGMSDLGEDMVQVFREYGLTPADNNNSKNMCQGVFDCLAWTAWCLDADRQLVTGSIPPMFQRLVEIAKARQSRGGSLSSPMAAGSLSAAGSGHDTKALQNLVGHSASFDGIITPLPKNIPWDTRRPRLYTGACGAQPQINRAAFVNDVLERLWKTANSFHPCSLSAIFGSDPSASALKKHKLYSTAVAAISLVDRVQSYHTVDAAQSRTSTSPSCIKKWWIQHPYQVGRSGVLAGDADNSAACHQENGSGSGSGNNNNNNTTTTTTTSNNSRSSSRSSSSSILDSTLESINVDQFLSVYDRHLIAVPIDKILPPHTSNMREYHHAVQHRLTASRTFAVFVAHRNRYHMRVFVAPVESEDEQSTIEMLSRRVELAYDALRVAEVCSQRENVVARFMFAQHQSQGSLGVSARAIVKEAGYFPPADDAFFTATVDDIDMNGSMYDDATLLRMLVESLELAADYGLANGDLVDSRSRAMKATKAHTATTATEQYSRFEDFYLVADGLIEESKLAKAANDPMSFLLSSEEFGYKGYAVLMSADDKAKAHFSAPGKPGIALIRTLPVLTPVGDNTGELDNQLPRHGAGSHDYSVGIALVPSITAVCAIPATYPASFGVTHTSYSINDSAYSPTVGALAATQVSFAVWTAQQQQQHTNALRLRSV
ncbi:hypothetical protein GQ42DRAFT_169848 [Ramicandelaber brevisporus]|nr:hypothetical protein GQ42DRAFT_169848 [Ramicandelaber brevisporus]